MTMAKAEKNDLKRITSVERGADGESVVVKFCGMTDAEIAHLVAVVANRAKRYADLLNEEK